MVKGKEKAEEPKREAEGVTGMSLPARQILVAKDVSSGFGKKVTMRINEQMRQQLTMKEESAISGKLRHSNGVQFPLFARGEYINNISLGSGKMFQVGHSHEPENAGTYKVMLSADQLISIPDPDEVNPCGADLSVWNSIPQEIMEFLKVRKLFVPKVGIIPSGCRSVKISGWTRRGDSFELTSSEGDLCGRDTAKYTSDNGDCGQSIMAGTKLVGIHSHGAYTDDPQHANNRFVLFDAALRHHLFGGPSKEVQDF